MVASFPPRWVAPGPPGGRLRSPAGAPSVNIKLFTRRLASLRSVSWSRSSDRARWRVTQEGAIGLGLGSGAGGSDDDQPKPPPSTSSAQCHSSACQTPPAQCHSSACRRALGSIHRSGLSALKRDSAEPAGSQICRQRLETVSPRAERGATKFAMPVYKFNQKGFYPETSVERTGP